MSLEKTLQNIHFGMLLITLWTALSALVELADNGTLKAASVLVVALVSAYYFHTRVMWYGELVHQTTE